MELWKAQREYRLLATRLRKSAPAGDVWNERIYDPEVRIDAGVAQVWAYYTFHRNGTFSHCGIDAFMLVKVGDAWKITQVADTRRTANCTHTVEE